MRILFPMVALAALSFAVLLLIPLRRFRAGIAGQVSYDDFKYGESERVPPGVAFAASNVVLIMLWTNLFRTMSS